MTRTRICTGPGPCSEPLVEFSGCVETDCPKPVFWSEWTKFDDCTKSCAGGTQQRSRFCSGKPYESAADLRPGTECGGKSANSEQFQSQPCNTGPCQRLVNPECSCPDGEIKCRSVFCPKNHWCAQTNWINETEAEFDCFEYKQLDCLSWGDPHIVTFDNAKVDVYGEAQYVLSERNGTSLLPYYKVLLNTRKSGRVAYNDEVYFTCETRTGGLIEFETHSYKDEQNIYFNDQWIKLLPQSNADFSFEKRGRWVYIRCWSGVEIWHKGRTYKVSIPAYYREEIQGLCQDCNFDLNNDYKKKDGALLPVPDQRGYRLSWQEKEVAESWITGSAGLRGCLPYIAMDYYI